MVKIFLYSVYVAGLSKKGDTIMSEQDLKRVIGKAVYDIDFRNKLLSEPSSCLSEYDLSEEEVSQLEAMQTSDFESLAQDLEERLSVQGAVSTSGRCAKATGF